MIQQVMTNWVCWAIICVALVCYQQLWLEWLNQRNPLSKSNEHCSERQRGFAGILIGITPLLGLLGTIVGLLECFANMARGDIDAGVVSGGIADALLTTQLGLICAIPGWVLYGFIQSRNQRAATQGAP